MAIRIKICCSQFAEEAEMAIAARPIATVHPFGVDICSALREDGKRVPDKLHIYVQAVRPVEKQEAIA